MCEVLHVLYTYHIPLEARKVSIYNVGLSSVYQPRAGLDRPGAMGV